MEESGEDTPEDAPRSLQSRIVTPVRFVNRSGRKIKIMWINYDGVEEFYTKLSVFGTDSSSRGHCFVANTFVTHPWIAVDEKTNERMLLDFKKVYFPCQPRIRRVDYQGKRAFIERAEVIVTSPVYTLEEYCRKVLKTIVSAENIGKLPLPSRIREEILHTV